jgi:hypothetical protein
MSGCDPCLARVAICAKLKVLSRQYFKQRAERGDRDWLKAHGKVEEALKAA